MGIKLERGSSLYNNRGRRGRLGIGKTCFHANFVFNPNRPEEDFIPGTRVRRLRPIPLGLKAVGFASDEVDELIAALRRERDDHESRREPGSTTEGAEPSPAAKEFCNG